MADDPITRHFFNGFIRLHVLYHAAKDRVYGAEITEELVGHGYRLSAGTLYPTLHLLERLGYLRSTTALVQGRRRKYYRATAAGRAILTEARQKLQELVAEVIEDHDQGFQTIRQKRHARRAATTRPAPRTRKKRRPAAEAADHADGGPR